MHEETYRILPSCLFVAFKEGQTLQRGQSIEEKPSSADCCAV